MRRRTGIGSSPVGCLGCMLALVCAPWLIQRHLNRESIMGVSRLGEASEQLWRRIALIAAGLLIAAFLLGWRAGWFHDWLNW
jgi:hypothetical protein